MDFDPKIQEIKPGPIDALSISLDYDTDPEQTYPVFLFTPDEAQFDHWHICLDREQATILRDWLDAYLASGSSPG